MYSKDDLIAEGLRSILRKGLVDLQFTKVNGEARAAVATLNELYLPAAPEVSDTDAPKKVKAPTPGVVPFWDVEAKAWRSLKVENFVSANLQETA